MKTLILNGSPHWDGDFIPYRDQWAYLSSVKKIDETSVDSLVEKLCGKSELGELYEEELPDKPWEIRMPDTGSVLFPQSLEAVLANMLYIPKRGISQSGLNRLKRLACFKNPDFYKAQAMRMSTYDKPRIISLAEEDERYIMLPRGCREALENLLAEHSCKLTVRDERNTGRTIDVTFSGELFGKQEDECVLRIEDEVLAGELSDSVERIKL